MKILHLLTTDRFSGAESVIIQIMEMFRGERDFEMAYASPDGPIREILTERGFLYFPMKKLDGAEIKRVLLEYQPEVLHAHDFTASVFAARAYRGTIISHLHNNPPWIKGCNPKTLLYLSQTKRFSNILAVSSAVRDEFWHHEKFEKKVSVIGNPFDASAVRDLAGEGSAPETEILFLGRFMEQKDPLRFLALVKAVKEKMPHVRAAMVGDGILRSAAEEKIRELGLSENVRLAGFQKNPCLWLENTKVLLMPSKFEGFGLAALEAMALSKPVVCSGAGGLKDLVDETCGAVCGMDSDYANELSKLLSDPDYYEKKAAGAAKRAEERSQPKDYKRTLMEIYAGGDHP